MNIHFTSNISRFTLAGLVVAALSACADQPRPDGHDYRQTHKIQVTSEQVSIAVALMPSGQSLSPADASRFKRFLRDYVQRGRTVVTVESAQPTLVHDMLLNHGLRDSEIFIAPTTTVRAPNVVLSFTANKAISPECGDFSSAPSGSFGNAQHSNYGCSIQRNIGQMVADPGDFIQAKPAEGKNAGRTDVDIFKQQSGTVRPRLLDGTNSGQ